MKKLNSTLLRNTLWNLTLGPETTCPSVVSKLFGRKGPHSPEFHRTMQMKSQPCTVRSCQPVEWVDFRPGCDLDSLSQSSSDLSTSPKLDNPCHSAQPFAIRGAMQEGWPVLLWTPRDLLDRCGDCEVPVEVSSGGGDYRDMYSNPSPKPGRRFEAGVPVPLSLLLSSMQESQVRWQLELCLFILMWDWM